MGLISGTTAFQFWEKLKQNKQHSDLWHTRWWAFVLFSGSVLMLSKLGKKMETGLRSVSNQMARKEEKHRYPHPNSGIVLVVGLFSRKSLP
jgi:hypothetical protein